MTAPRIGRHAFAQGAPRAAVQKETRDSGVTLVELLVGMAVLSMLLAMFGTALTGLLRSVNTASQVSAAVSATRNAFLLLDKQIRYATEIAAPATIGTDQWIEWAVTDPAIPVAQSPTQQRCYQWRASSSTRLLQFRSWVVPATGAATASPWSTVVTNLTISGAVFTTTRSDLQVAPFSLPATAVSSGHVQVGVTMTSQSTSTTGHSGLTTTFTALNTGGATTAVCTEVARS